MKKRSAKKIAAPTSGHAGDGREHRKMSVHITHLGEVVRSVGLTGLVFGLNPLAAHLVVHTGGPPMLAYGFASFCMVLFFGWWTLKAFPPFKNIVV